MEELYKLGKDENSSSPARVFTCVVDSTQRIHMVMHIGGVRAPLATIFACKFWPRPLQPDAQSVPASKRRKS